MNVEYIRKNRFNKLVRFVFSSECFDIINKYIWNQDRDGYVYNNEGVPLHRILLDADEYDFVDHINGNPSDNRMINIRICTPSQNSKNRKVNSNNKSGVSGVCWHKRDKKWMASIGVDCKRINLGSFDLIDDAICARLDAESEFFGNFSRGEYCDVEIHSTFIDKKDAPLRSSNKSGVKNVYFCEAVKKWRAQGYKNKKTIYIGQYETKEEAIKAKECWNELENS